MYKKFKKIYKEALRLSIKEFKVINFFQLWYIGVIIAELSFLYNIDVINVSVYSIIISLHFLSMYLLGYYMFNENISKTIKLKRKDYKTIYIMANVILTITATIITRSLFYFFIIFVATFGFFILFLVAATILQFINALFKDDEYIFKHKIIVSVVFFITAFAIVAISVFSTNVFFIKKIIIVGLYVFLSPLIIMNSKNGIHFLEFFDVLE